MASARLDDFKEDIARAKDIIGLGQAIGRMTNGRVDASDLYRAALVQGVAAWDRYVHGIVLDRAVDILVGRRLAGGASKIGLPLASVAAILTEPDAALRELGARSSVAQRLVKETFQQPDDVAAALALVGGKSRLEFGFLRTRIPQKYR